LNDRCGKGFPAKKGLDKKSDYVIILPSYAFNIENIVLVQNRNLTAETPPPAGRQGERRGYFIFPLPLRGRQRET
jgi:hypothetical protein